MSDKSQGLNSWARQFLERKPVLLYTEKIVRVYPDGKEEVIDPHPVYRSAFFKEEEVESYDFESDDQEYVICIGPLNQYEFSDGKIYPEHVQHVYNKKIGWFSSESTYFLALKDWSSGEWIKESLWAQEEIKAVCGS